MFFSRLPKKLLPSLLLIGSLTFFGCQERFLQEEIFVKEEKGKDTEGIKFIDNQFIVVLKEGTFSRYLSRIAEGSDKERNNELYGKNQEMIRDLVNDLVAEYGVTPDAIEFVYSDALLGFSGKFSPRQIEAIKSDKRVDYVEQDQMMYISDGGGGSTARVEAQTTPWGISRVGTANYAGGSRWAWVIDSGIDAGHPDLNVNTSYSRSFVSGYSGTSDSNGHGTHVAGTIAAINNGTGVVGVAAGATVVSCRVFAGSNGSNSAVIAAVNYVGASGNGLSGDVVNMSLGGGRSTSLDNAIRNVARRGIVFALAAGNEAQNANNVSPARVNGNDIWTVSAMDRNSRYASFSNYANPPIDVCAPGVDILSTWPGGGYRSISGTSMATPHVAGILLVNNGTIYGQGTVRNDPDGRPDPIARL
ncbi:MAG: S8 family serine peptidase [Bacteroidota bacterium]